MTPNNRNRYNQEEQTRIQNDPLNHTPTTHTSGMANQPIVDESKKAAYHDGYVHGQVVENSRREQHLVDRDNNNAARGLLLGVLLTSLLGLTAGALYLWNERNEEVYEPASPVVVPSASPTPRLERETTIIERAVPIPQPAPQQTTAPEVNITPQLENPAPVENPINSTPTTQPDINITVPNSQTQEVPATEASPTTPEAGVNGETGVIPEDQPVNEVPDNTSGSSENAAPSVPSADLSGGSNQ